jgi:hypothetical protein
VLCHNVLEVLPAPDALVAEAIRVLRPGGRLVLAHSDFDTLIFASEDLALTRRLVRDYCDTQQNWMDAVDGTSAGAWPTPSGAPAGPPRPSSTAGWPGCSDSTTGGRSCSVSTTTPSSVVECPSDALHATGATVRRPTSR